MKIMKTIRLICASSLLLVLCSCAKKPQVKPSTVDDFFPVTEPIKPAPEELPPQAVTDALIPGYNETLLAPYTASQPPVFNISVHQIDAREFFMGLVIDSQENIVVHPDVQGDISLELKNVTVLQVLDAVRSVYGYDYSYNDFGHIIYPATLQSKIFKINRLDLMREGNSRTRVSSGQVSDTRKSRSNEGNEYSSSETSGSWINTTSKTDFWEELKLSLNALVSVDKNASIVINKQTGIVVVRAKPMQMREIEKLIASTQNQISRQVIIEAKILEIILDDNHQDGVNWAALVREGTQAFLTSSNPLPSVVKTTTDVFTIGVNSGDFYAFIELMESQGKTNILSSPRISTLNNQKAIIKVGQDEYFITDVSTDNVSSAATTTINQDITWTPFFSGIALDVTPQIDDKQNITLHIHPSITRVENQDKKFNLNGTENQIPLALNTVRESDSIVHAKSGQIIVIGGLMQENREEQKRGVSLLSRIPFVGHAFREDKGTGKKSELVILLKPIVIESGLDWNKPIQSSHDRMRKLEQFEMWK